MYLYSVDYNFEAFLDGKPIYRFGEISADGRGSFVGWPWHLIRLPDNYGGKTLSLRVYSDYDEIGIYGESAGHPPLLLLKNRGKEMIELKPQGRLIAQLPRSSEYGIEKVEIERGDRILIYTDGVVELRDQAGRAFGEERLMQLFREGAEISSGKFADSLLASLRKWSGENTGFQDDVCYLLLDVA